MSRASSSWSNESSRLVRLLRSSYALVLGDPYSKSVGKIASAQAGHSSLPEISGRAFRVFNISGFQQLNLNSSPKFRVPVISGTSNYEFEFGYPQTTRYYQILIEQHTHRV
jgi:hypothetical protein